MTLPPSSPQRTVEIPLTRFRTDAFAAVCARTGAPARSRRAAWAGLPMGWWWLLLLVPVVGWVAVALRLVVGRVRGQLPVNAGVIAARRAAARAALRSTRRRRLRRASLVGLGVGVLAGAFAARTMYVQPFDSVEFGRGYHERVWLPRVGTTLESAWPTQGYEYEPYRLASTGCVYRSVRWAATEYQRAYREVTIESCPPQLEVDRLGWEQSRSSRAISATFAEAERELSGVITGEPTTRIRRGYARPDIEVVAGAHIIASSVLCANGAGLVGALYALWRIRRRELRRRRPEAGVVPMPDCRVDRLRSTVTIVGAHPAFVAACSPLGRSMDDVRT